MDFITPQEKKELEARLEHLRAQRPGIIERIADARTKGDLRENADYHAAREDQAMNERQVRDLEHRLATAHVTDGSNVPQDMVFLGATVRLRDVATGEEDLYRLVGEAKIDFSLDYIEVSVSSPMGQSLMKARVGEKVRVDLPKGTKQFEIVDIVT